jgi:hypothetical protein
MVPMQTTRLVLRSLLLVVLGSMFSCAPAATYPPTEGTTSLGPKSPPVPELMAESVRYAHSRLGRTDAVVINLPPDTPPEVWEEVLRRLPTAAPMRSTEELAYHIKQVRLDGSKAEVDLIYRRENFNQLMTVVFEGAPFRPWRALHHTNWRVPVESPGPTFPEGAWEAYQRTSEWSKSAGK